MATVGYEAAWWQTDLRAHTQTSHIYTASDVSACCFAVQRYNPHQKKSDLFSVEIKSPHLAISLYFPSFFF